MILGQISDLHIKTDGKKSYRVVDTAQSLRVEGNGIAPSESHDEEARQIQHRHSPHQLGAGLRDRHGGGAEENRDERHP